MDFADPEFVRDPYPALSRLRARAPVSFHEPSGQWLAAGHAAVNAVLRDDLISHLAAVDLSADELVASAILLLSAGHEPR